MSTAMSSANAVYCHKHLQDQVSDYSIPIAAWNKLKAEFPHDCLQHLSLNTFNRVLLITGQLPSQDLRNQIEQTLQTVPRIARIFNATTIEPPATAAQHIKDSWITTKIKSKMIASNDIYADKIKVITEKNIVYLMGIITKEESNIAIDIAKETEGVKKVVNIFYYMTMPNI